MAIVSRTDLIAQITAVMNRDDLDAIIPIAIGLVENDFNRRVFCPDRQGQVALTFTSGVAALPDDFHGVIELRQAGTNRAPLEAVPIDDLRHDWPVQVGGTPRYFAIDGTDIEIAPFMDGDLELSYWQTIPPLGDTVPTNWLLLRAPDLYLSATVAWLHSYVMDEQRSIFWTAQAEKVIENLNREGVMRAINSGPLARRAQSSDAILVYR